MEKIIQYDLFGNKIEEKEILRDKFMEPPFSVLDTKQASWINRKRKWIDIGIKGDDGRKNINPVNAIALRPLTGNRDRLKNKGISIFNPALCELMYSWFCPDKGHVLDPFAGGAVRGIVAHYLGYKYTGVDIRQEQIDVNRKQALDILPINNQPNWYTGDSLEVIKDLNVEYDFILSCPPYANLEKYSDLDGDISNKNYPEFIELYSQIIKQSCLKLKKGCFACFVVGEVRDKKGYFLGFVPDTIKIFQKYGMKFYNELIFLDQLGNAAMRAKQFSANHKLAKVHQNVLIFKKD
ncbi:MAG: hypothetical protein GY870_08970 [archaeon]|nr:hypothetical protein [archaeon]